VTATPAARSVSPWPRFSRFAGGLAGRTEELQQGTPDRRLAGAAVIFRAEQIGDVEHVDHALAEGRHMGRSDVEVEFRDRRVSAYRRPGRSSPLTSTMV